MSFFKLANGKEEREVNTKDKRLQSRFSREQVDDLAEEAKVDFKKIPRSQFVRGLKVEREHADVLKGNEETLARVAAAHLKELPDYYTRLAKVEKKASIAKRASEKVAIQGQGHVSSWDNPFDAGRPPSGMRPSIINPQDQQQIGKGGKRVGTNPVFKNALQEALFKKRKYVDGTEQNYAEELKQDLIKSRQQQQISSERVQTQPFMGNPLQG